MDLFEGKREQHRQAVEPLASRMRPRTLAEYAGQQHILGEGTLLRRMLAADRLGSVILYGPPGTGKTTLADLIAQHTAAHFDRGNAAAMGVKDVRFVQEQAARRLADTGRRTILFLDEIHRFSKAQQDVLLSDVERGGLTLIGATTENPQFTVNAALVSRSQVFALEPLTPNDVAGLLNRALADAERGLGGLGLTIDDDALKLLSVRSDGDARRALTALEIAARSQADRGASAIDLSAAEQSLQRKQIAYDRDGTAHHDTISAFIKSMRASEADTAVYWLAVMLHAGEDPAFIARRIAIFASEDVGNADPQAIRVAAAACDIVQRIGLPEGRITLAQATRYMAAAPKSRADYDAIGAALQQVADEATRPVPPHQRSASNRRG